MEGLQHSLRRGFSFDAQSDVELNSITEIGPAVSTQFLHHSAAISVEIQRKDYVEPEIEPTIISDDAQIDYHIISTVELGARLRTDLQNGLSDEEATRILATDGLNAIEKKNKHEWVTKLLRYFFGGFGVILWPAAFMCFMAWRPLGDPPDPVNLGVAVILLIVIVLQAGFNAWQDWKSNQVMSSIRKMLPSTATVVRSGKIKEVPLTGIVAGDIIVLNTGDKVPADCRVINCSGLKVDNAILTGESKPVGRTLHTTDRNFMETKNLCFMGASVVEGTGIGVVVATGNSTVMGKISIIMDATTESTPLRKEITRFVLCIAALAFVTAATVFFTWLFYLKPEYPGFMDLSAVIVTCIGGIVAYLPDGLPIAVSLTLTVVAKKMYEQNVLVKNLHAVETLGSVDIIASDKTGTLTQNNMSVMDVYVGGIQMNVGQIRQVFESESLGVVELLHISALCNRATYEASTSHLPIAQRKVVGDASDSALLNFTEDLCNVESLRLRYRLLAEIPFNSKNKWMLSIRKHPTDNRALLMLKGAAEIILERCSTFIASDGRELPLTKDIKDGIVRHQEQFSDNGERVLGLSRLYLDADAFPVDSFQWNVDDINFPTQGLCFIGLVALIDPPRSSVPSSVAQCQSAGIKVMMVTGDHPNTAIAIARMVGIAKSGLVIHVAKDEDLAGIPTGNGEIVGQVVAVKGIAVPQLTKTSWDKILQHREVVFARTSPEHKLQIVRECQNRQHIVAVTGDGVNDVPALKQANVGVAMGSGSDMAREAADIVLLNSSFTSLVVGIQSGRLAFENLKKVILYLLPAGSFSELMPILANVFFGVPLPLSSFLMIAICVGTDIFPSLAMIYEQSESDLMLREPRSKTGEKLVNAQLLFHAYAIVGILEALCGFTMFFWYMKSYGGFGISDLFFAFDAWTDQYGGKSQEELDELLYTGQTVYFVALVLAQFGNIISTRTRRASFFSQSPLSKGHKNTFMFVAVGLSLNITLFIVYLPVFQDNFNTRPIPNEFWVAPLCFSFAIFCIDEGRKWLVRRFSVLSGVAW